MPNSKNNFNINQWIIWIINIAGVEKKMKRINILTRGISRKSSSFDVIQNLMFLLWCTVSGDPVSGWRHMKLKIETPRSPKRCQCNQSVLVPWQGIDLY
jgi:hypothetical protein